MVISPDNQIMVAGAPTETYPTGTRLNAGAVYLFGEYVNLGTIQGDVTINSPSHNQTGVSQTPTLSATNNLAWSGGSPINIVNTTWLVKRGSTTVYNETFVGWQPSVNLSGKGIVLNYSANHTVTVTVTGAGFTKTDVNSFTVQDAPPTFAFTPSILSPSDGATGVGLTPTFTADITGNWTNGTPGVVTSTRWTLWDTAIEDNNHSVLWAKTFNGEKSTLNLGSADYDGPVLELLGPDDDASYPGGPANYVMRVSIWVQNGPGERQSAGTDFYTGS
jgi:hypothetical protein